MASNRTGITGVDYWFKTGDVFGFDIDSQLIREDWEKISVLHGVPEAGCELNGGEFPSELGLDTWAVDFRKGCYLGQEIVSRIQSVGQTKRNLYLFVSNKSKEKGEVIAILGTEIGKSTRKSVQIGKDIWVTLAFLKSIVVDSLITDNEENRKTLFLPRHR
jgi:folate-binding protein YgfZ